MHDAPKSRGRGRPKGSSRYVEKDAALLQQVSDLMIGDNKLSVTAAIKRTTGRPSDETLTHRLRGKIKPNIAQYLDAARERAEQRRQASIRVAASRPADAFGAAMRASALMNTLELSRTTQALAKQVAVPEMLKASALVSKVIEGMNVPSMQAMSQAVAALHASQPSFITMAQAMAQFAKSTKILEVTSATALAARHMEALTRATGLSATAAFVQAEQASLRATGLLVAERFRQADEAFMLARARPSGDGT